MFSANEHHNKQQLVGDKSARVYSPELDKQQLAQMLSCSALPMSISSRVSQIGSNKNSVAAAIAKQQALALQKPHSRNLQYRRNIELTKIINGNDLSATGMTRTQISPQLNNAQMQRKETY